MIKHTTEAAQVKPLLKSRRSSLQLKFLKNAFEEVNILIATFRIVIFKNTFFSRTPPMASSNITLNLTLCSRLWLCFSAIRTLPSEGCCFLGVSLDFFTQHLLVVAHICILKRWSKALKILVYSLTWFYSESTL